MKYEKYLLSLVFLPLGCAFLMTSIIIYPEMVKYQPSSKLGATIKTMEPKMESILSFGIPRSKRSYEFYSDRLMVFELNKQNLEKLENKLKESKLEYKQTEEKTNKSMWLYDLNELKIKLY